MKRLIILIMCVCLLFSSCSKNNAVIDKELSFWDCVFRTDDYVCHSMLKVIIKSIETKNKDLLISAFSENSKRNCESIEEQVDTLFNYCSGELLSLGQFRGLPNTSTHYHKDELVKKSHIPTYDINTSNGSYRLTFEYIQIDSNNIDNEGLWSLYVIKAEDDTDTTSAYRITGEYIPGIHTGIVDGVSSGD